eukprot:3237798-Alexandrium_andersonii.AAC.1
MQRKRGEIMVAYGSREELLYHRLQQAFARVKGSSSAAVLDDQLRGVLLLYNSSLDSTERAS